MRINFSTASIPTRSAKRLKSLLNIKESAARAVTAYVLGYRDWHELNASLNTEASSQLDEDCDTKTVQARRAYQLARLAEYRPLEAQLNNASALLEVWQPSAGRPQEPASAKAIDSDASLDDQRRFLELILAMQNVRDPVVLARMVDDNLTTLLAGIRAAKRPASLAGMAEIASRILSSPVHQMKATARRILEALAAREQHNAMVNLSMALRLGDGGPQDFKRAGDLLERVIALPDVEVTLRRTALSSLADLFFRGEGRGFNPARALALFEEAAHIGNAQAAFNVALLHASRPGAPQVVQQDLNKAVRFYRIAAEAGHAHAATNLGLLLLTNLSLANNAFEPEHWLTVGASLGDQNAAAALREIDKITSRTMSDTDKGRIPDYKLRQVQEDMMAMARGENPFKEVDPSTPPRPPATSRRGRPKL